jgi:hypothetical protein
MPRTHPRARCLSLSSSTCASLPRLCAADSLKKTLQIAADALLAQRELLAEYFMRITPEGRVETLPRLLRRYTPNLDRLPLFVLRIALQVGWCPLRILRDRR